LAGLKNWKAVCDDDAAAIDSGSACFQGMSVLRNAIFAIEDSRLEACLGKWLGSELREGFIYRLGMISSRPINGERKWKRMINLEDELQFVSTLVRYKCHQK
jgi:hypothetical protein